MLWKVQELLVQLFLLLPLQLHTCRLLHLTYHLLLEYCPDAPSSPNQDIHMEHCDSYWYPWNPFKEEWVSPVCLILSFNPTISTSTMIPFYGWANKVLQWVQSWAQGCKWQRGILDSRLNRSLVTRVKTNIFEHLLLAGSCLSTSHTLTSLLLSATPSDGSWYLPAL